MLAALLLATAAYGLCALFTRHNPVPRRFLRALGTIAGLRLRIRGALAHENTFLLANHVSWLDIPALAGASGCAFVAHDGLAEIGPLRWLCSLNDTVFIARHDRRSVGAQIEQVRTALADTGSLAIFPEGTTGDGRELLPFKSSLLAAIESDLDHVAVQPVRLDYGEDAREIAWVGAESGIDNALRILARACPVTLTIHFLEPLSDEQRADRKVVAREARKAIAQDD